MSDPPHDPVPSHETSEETAPRAPTSIGWALRLIQVRLRLVVLLGAAFLVVGQWDALRNHGDRLMRWARGSEARDAAVSSDTEYFCPMDPGVVSDWPGKCSICNMALVRRTRGEAVALPDGVVARMQLSPYRLQLAGIQTASVAFRPLAREVLGVGKVGRQSAGERVVEAEVFAKDLPLLRPGLEAEVKLEDAPALLRGRVESIPDDPASRGGTALVRLRLDDPGGALRPGISFTARIRSPIDEQEPFRSMPAGAPPLRPGEPRTAYVCPDHPDAPREAPGLCPVDRNALEARPLEANQRLAWWCPMHPSVTADRTGAACRECGGMRLVPRVVTYRPPGEVPSIPESAVVDTGSRQVVYVERMPGMFDGVEVVLGPRCGSFYPVARGLEPGQRVAAAGAFLVDAETRLNPSVAAAYFGSGSRPRGENPAAAAPVAPTTQKVCPVTGKALGSMGPPFRVTVEGKTVFLCCDACEERLRKDPGKYLSRVP